ncbi:MAG: type I pullulanase [Clostridia bacterium]|nr:type I pullulanase [Clostridia bacterium]
MLKFEGKKWLCAMLAAVMIAASPLNGILTVFAEPDEDEEVYDEAEYNDEEVYGFDDPNEDDLYNDPDENIDDVVVDEYIEEDVEAYDDYTEATGVYDDQGDESEEDTDTDTEKTDSDNQKSMGESSVAELDKLAYNGSDLGAVYTKESTTFKVWSPKATRVQVVLYATGSDKEENSKYISVTDMEYDETCGVWSAVIEGDLLNKYYTYYVYNGKKGKETVDIYAKAAGVNGNRGMIVDLESTNPEGWENDKHVSVGTQSEAVVWEVNVKDFSSDPASGVSEKNRGKYLAFTETGTTVNSNGVTTTGLDYLKELGVNYVQLLPIFDFGSIDESSKDDQFNWGYDPKNYNVPEGSYSSDPYDGNVRINEVKQMIQSIHNNGMGVVMDVVFNHTYDGAKSWFNITVPDYYYRFTDSGTWSNGSGCGNDTASEHAMFRKYMVDSVVYWAKEYHIDGFRFDLMGLHDVDTMNAIRRELDALEGGDKILMYGEGWSLGTSAEPGTVMATQYNVSKMSDRIGAFNDGLRDGVKGSNFNASEGGFIQGGQGTAKVKSGITGETISSWAKTPTQTVTYNSCHDNYTLWDKLVATSGSFEDYTQRNENLVAMNKLASAIALTSQGISFFQAGEEFARTKKGDENSYRSSSKINRLDWERRLEYSDLVQYYAGLIEIRKNFAPFTDATGESAKKISFIPNTPKNVIAYTLKNTVTQGTQWDQVAVFFNASPNDEQITLSGSDLPEEWVIIANGDSAGLNGLGLVNENTVKVKAGQALVIVDKESFDKLALKSDKGSVIVRHADADTGETIKLETVVGLIGKKYALKPDTSISAEYTYRRTEGSVNGKFSAEGANVTFYYTKYNGTFGTVVIKFVDSETGNELYDPITQRGRTGERYFTAEIPTIKGYALDLRSLPKNGAGKYTNGNIDVVYKYAPVENEPVTVHYYNSNKWDNITLYSYGNGVQNSREIKELLGNWPGTAMSNDGDGWWTYTIPADVVKGVTGVKVIIANGNAQDPLSGNEGYLVSGEAWIKDGVVSDKNDKEIVYTGNINVLYVDYSGSIIDKDVITGDISSEYNIVPREFFGYELASQSDNTAGYYTAEEINVIFNYIPNYGKGLIVWLAAGGIVVLAGGIAAFILRKKKS